MHTFIIFLFFSFFFLSLILWIAFFELFNSHDDLDLCLEFVTMKVSFQVGQPCKVQHLHTLGTSSRDTLSFLWASEPSSNLVMFQCGFSA